QTNPPSRSKDSTTHRPRAEARPPQKTKHSASSLTVDRTLMLPLPNQRLRPSPLLHLFSLPEQLRNRRKHLNRCHRSLKATSLRIASSQEFVRPCRPW